MLRFTFDGYEIADAEELFQSEFDSAYAAVTACLDPSRHLNYLLVRRRCDDSEYGTISPYAVWATREAFEETLRNQRLAFKIQLNIELSQDRATEDLIIRVLDKGRLA